MQVYSWDTPFSVKELSIHTTPTSTVAQHKSPGRGELRPSDVKMAESVTVVISGVDNQRVGADFASASQFYELKIINLTVLRHQAIQFRQAQY